MKIKKELETFIADVQVGPGCLKESGLPMHLFLAQTRVTHPIYTCRAIDYDDVTGFMTIEFKPPNWN